MGQGRSVRGRRRAGVGPCARPPSSSSRCSTRGTALHVIAATPLQAASPPCSPPSRRPASRPSRPSTTMTLPMKWPPRCARWMRCSSGAIPSREAAGATDSTRCCATPRKPVSWSAPIRTRSCVWAPRTCSWRSRICRSAAMRCGSTASRSSRPICRNAWRAVHAYSSSIGGTAASVCGVSNRRIEQTCCACAMRSAAARKSRWTGQRCSRAWPRTSTRPTAAT